MDTLIQQLNELHAPRWLGLGNPSSGDDAAGIRLAAALQAGRVPHVDVAGLEPDSWLCRTAIPRGSHLVFLDAADFGAEPGSVTFLSGQLVRTRFPQVSTHRLSLGTLATLVTAQGAAGVWLLGIQPGSLRVGMSLTPPVEQSVRLLRDQLVARFGPTGHDSIQSNKSAPMLSSLVERRKSARYFARPVT
jgi:hydrogenase maturation protease